MDRPHLPCPDPLDLPLGRVHELVGTARRSLAVMLAAALEGPVVWLRTPAARGRLMPDGLAPFLNPGRILEAGAARPVDLLWAMEEALRSGAAPVVVAELPEALPLTPVRRLTLAAEATPEPVLPLLLTPEGEAQGVETRWRCDPMPAGWTLTRLRARMRPPQSWALTWRDGPRLAPAPLAA